MTIDELVDNFALFDDWEDRYRYLIDLGAALPPMEPALRTEATKVRGCMSQVWMVLAWDSGGRLHMEADSDAQIVKGLIAVLRIIYEGVSPEAAREADVEGIFGRLGLDRHLSPNRRNGFFAMVEKVRGFAAQRPV